MVEESFINPDLLIERPDGYFDIVDFKLAGIHKKKLTKASRKRRRFIDYVCEGIAQLSNYEFYFSFEGNQKHALEKFGVKVRNPNLMLVIGNDENYIKQEVEEALRVFKNSKLKIVDYDTLISKFLNESKSESDFPQLFSDSGMHLVQP